jgi:hypothetical protein
VCVAALFNGRGQCSAAGLLAKRFLIIQQDPTCLGSTTRFGIEGSVSISGIGGERKSCSRLSANRPQGTKRGFLYGLAAKHTIG